MLGYSWIKIDHIADSLLKLKIKIGVHLINIKLSQLLPPFPIQKIIICLMEDVSTLRPKNLIMKMLN